MDVDLLLEDVVKIRGVVVRIECLLAAVVADGATCLAAAEQLFAFIVYKTAPCVLVHTARHEQAHEEVQPADGEDQQEEEHHNERVFQHWDGFHDGLHDTLETLNIVDESEGAQDTEGTKGAK